MSDPDPSRLRVLARPLLDAPPVEATPVEELQRRVRRRRQRRSGMAGVTLLVVAGLCVWIAAPFSSSPRSVDTGTAPTTLTGPPTTVATVAPDTATVVQMHLRSATEGYAANGLGLYVTDDSGAHWRDIDPPGTYDPVGHMTAITFLDARHVWTSWALNSHPISNYRSTDGGRTWTPGATCGSVECPFFSALTFVDAHHGWALAGNDTVGTGVVYSTTDGGATWSTIGPAPFNGDLQFLDARHGWGRTGPSGTAGNGGVADAGGALFRTDDGGHTWTSVDPLGIGPGSRAFAAFAIYSMPRFFGAEGVALAGVHSATPDTVIDVLVTHDGGSTWHSQPTPIDPNASTYTGETGFPFSATNPTDWTLYVGPNLYSTTDAGATWTTIRPAPTWPRILAVDFVTPDHGWANVLNQTCATAPTGACTVPILVTTDDGGRTWTALDPK